MMMMVSRPVASSTSSASVRHYFLMHPPLRFSLTKNRPKKGLFQSRPCRVSFLGFCFLFRVLFFFEGPLHLRFCLPFRVDVISKRRDKTRGPCGSPSWTSRREERRLARPLPLLLLLPPPRPKPFSWRREDVAEDASLKTSAGKPLCGFPRAQSDDKEEEDGKDL